MKNLSLGILLTLVWWIIAWIKIPPLYEHAFFPLWLGYIITINNLSSVLLGRSLYSVMGKNFFILFILSIPLWWFFETFNIVTKNWSYIIPRPAGALEFIIRASVSFSTVIPALLSTCFFAYLALKRIKPIRVKPLFFKPIYLYISFILGLACFFLIFLLPKFGYPLLWVGLFLTLEPINYRFGYLSIFRKLSKGDLTLIASILPASLFTGFFWEMWNYYSLPKWVYSIPFAGYFKIFEMPILGFLGYPFFGLEIISFTSLTLSLIDKGLSKRLNINFHF